MLDNMLSVVKHSSGIELDTVRLARCYHPGMTTLRETRRQNLLDLVTEAGGQSALGALIGKERSQVWQWTLPEDDERGRGIGNTSARMIEAACKKPRGWLDADHAGHVGAWSDTCLPHSLQ